MADVAFTVGDALRRAGIRSVGYKRRGDCYRHALVPFFVEFPLGPLGVGNDFTIKPVLRARRGQQTLSLSATDSCRDRLAAFYHWPDPQSLAVAVAIARRQPVALSKIRRWSIAEGKLEQYEEFLEEIRRRRRRGVPDAKRRS